LWPAEPSRIAITSIGTTYSITWDAFAIAGHSRGTVLAG
jgi:hypothetical protein